MVRRPGADPPDLLFVQNVEDSALLEIKNGVVAFRWHQHRKIHLVHGSASEWIWELRRPNPRTLQLLRAAPADTGITPACALDTLGVVDRDGDGVPLVGFQVAGLDPPDKPERVIAMINAGWDCPPRGVAAFDFQSGRRLWLYPMAQDPQLVTPVDLAGELKGDVLVTGWAAGNQYARESRSDSVCCLALLDRQGKEMWYREGGRRGDFSAALAGAFSPDRRNRVAWLLTASSADRQAQTEIATFDAATGSPGPHLEYAGDCSGVVAADVNDDGLPEIVGGFSTGKLRAWNGNLELVREATFDDPVSVFFTVDLDGDEIPEIVGALGRRLCVFDRHFRLLAVCSASWLPTEDRGSTGGPSSVAALRDASGRWCLAAMATEGPALVLKVFQLEPASGLRLRGLSLLLADALAATALIGGILLGGAFALRLAGDPAAPGEPRHALPLARTKVLHREVAALLHAARSTSPLVRIGQLFDHLEDRPEISPTLKNRIADACGCFLNEGVPSALRPGRGDKRLGRALPELPAARASYTGLIGLVREMGTEPVETETLRRLAPVVAATAARTISDRRSLREGLRRRLRADLGAVFGAPFLERSCHEAKIEIDGFSREVHRWLLSCPWPGNVRELRNAVEAAVIRCPGRVLGIRDFPVRMPRPRSSPMPAADSSPGAQGAKGAGAQAAGVAGVQEAGVVGVRKAGVVGAGLPGNSDPLREASAWRSERRSMQREFLERLLREAGGNISQAARLAGMTRSGLQRMMKRLAADGEPPT